MLREMEHKMESKQRISNYKNKSKNKKNKNKTNKYPRIFFKKYNY